MRSKSVVLLELLAPIRINFIYCSTYGGVKKQLPNEIRQLLDFTHSVTQQRTKYKIIQYNNIILLQLLLIILIMKNIPLHDYSNGGISTVRSIYGGLRVRIACAFLSVALQAEYQFACSNLYPIRSWVHTEDQILVDIYRYGG